MAQVERGRVCRHGGSLAMIVSKRLLQALGWNVGDMIVQRVSGKHLILERVNMNDFAKPRMEETEEATS